MNTTSSKKSSWKPYLILGILSLIWGSSFILIKKALIVFMPVDLGFLRIGIAFLMYLYFIIREVKKVDWNQWKSYAAVGLLGSGLPSFLYAIAQTEITSSVTGILNSMTPIFTLLIGVVLFASSVTKQAKLGVIVGFLGAASLILFSDNNQLGGNPIYGLFIIGATICYACSVNLVKAKFQNVNPITVSSISFLFIGPIAITYLILQPEWLHSIQEHSYGWHAISATAVLAILGTFLANIIFYRLVQLTSAVFASSVAYLMPMIVLFWGIIDGESIGLFHLVGIIGILIGIFLIRKKPSHA